MKKVKNYLNSYLVFLAIIFATSLILSLFNLLGMPSNTTDILIMVVMLITFLIMGFMNGKKATKKGYLAGLKLGLSLVLILIIINLILYHHIFSLQKLVYYVLLVLASILGSMLGINRKK